MTLRLGYITNGFRDHSLPDVIEILSALRYQGIGITLDHGHLEPDASADELRSLRRRLEDAGLSPVIETGGRYVLDPRRKHFPNLLSASAEERGRRVDFYRRAVDIAEALGSSVVSLWSGAPPEPVETDEGWSRLLDALPPVLDHAQESCVSVAFEPEPGMFVESLADHATLRARLPHPALALTIDLGHLAVTEEEPWEEHVTAHLDQLVNVHLDDVRDRRHEHLPPGEGAIDFPPLLAALASGYDGLVLVELSRHSHQAPEQARRCREWFDAQLAALKGD